MIKNITTTIFVLATLTAGCHAAVTINPEGGRDATDSAGAGAQERAQSQGAPGATPEPSDGASEDLWPTVCGCEPECSISALEKQTKLTTEAVRQADQKYKNRGATYEAHVASVYMQYADCLANTSVSKAYMEERRELEDAEEQYRSEARNLIERCLGQGEPYWTAYCEGILEELEAREKARKPKKPKIQRPQSLLGPGFTNHGFASFPPTAPKSLSYAAWAPQRSLLGLETGLAPEPESPCAVMAGPDGGASLFLYFETGRPTEKDLTKLRLEGILRNYDEDQLNGCIADFDVTIRRAWAAKGSRGIGEMWSVVASTDYESHYAESDVRRARTLEENTDLRVRRAKYGEQVLLGLALSRAVTDVSLQSSLADPSATSWGVPAAKSGRVYGEWRDAKRDAYEEQRSVEIQYMVSDEAISTIVHVVRSLPKSGPVDLVLVIDATGSMHDDIDEVRARSTEIFSRLQDQNSDARVGVVVYRDRGDGPDWRELVLQPTSDRVVFEGAVASIEAMGGGDAEEDVCGGQHLALEGTDWRSGSTRIILTVGDADAKRYYRSPTCGDVATLNESVGAEIEPFQPLGRDIRRVASGVLGPLGVGR